jgi:hypothetical protein
MATLWNFTGLLDSVKFQTWRRKTKRLKTPRFL